MADIPFDNAADKLVIPPLGPVYDRFAQPMAYSVFRFAIGAMLVIEGWPKIIAPLAQTGWLWSPALAAMQFFGGMFIAVGLFTRPIALANAVMLAITLWFHWAHPYGEALVTQAGFDALKAGGDALITSDGLMRLADGGNKFLEQVQEKAELASLFWTGGAFLFAAFGGGYLSLDRLLFSKQL